MSDRDDRHHLHPLGALIYAGRVVRGIWPLFVIALVEDSRFPFFGILLGAVPVLATLGALAWWRFQYWIEGDELRIERGVLIRRKVFIPRDRIQAVNVSAGIIQRVFGLVRVKIETEASKTQAELAAVSRAEADRLESFLRDARRDESRQRERSESRAWTLSPGRLLLAASTSGRIGVLAAVVATIYGQLNEVVDPWLMEKLRSAGVANLSGISPTVIVGLIVALMLVSWILSIIAEAIRYGGFSVRRDATSLVVAHGLLERRDTVIPAARVQAVRIVEGLLRQPLGYAMVVVDASGHAGDRERATVLHPFLPRDELRAFLSELLPAYATALDGLDSLQSPPRRALRRFLIRPLVGLAVLSAIAAFVGTWAVGIVGLAALPILALSYLAWRQTGLALEPGFAVVRRRRRGARETAIVPRRRAQSVQVTRSWLQRWRELSSCTLVVASGDGAQLATARDLDTSVGDALMAWGRRSRDTYSDAVTS